MLTKFPTFWSNPWTNPFGKMPILWVVETDVFVVEKGLFAIWNVEKPFFEHLFLRSMTWEYRGLQEVTGGYKGLQGITRGKRGWQGVTKDYRNFFLTRTFPDTFSWSILHKNQSWRNLKFLTKTMDQNLWKNSNFAFFINSCFYSL